MEPLAISLRPKNLKEMIGQQHLIGPNKVISNMVNNGVLFSMILYGNPGIGKTSLANALVNSIDKKYRSLNAVINNKKDFDIVIEEAKLFDGLIVIMDEIHRLNKDKQDLLLPYLESGLITLIGLTTSNPYHKINTAIRSRCQIFELKELDLNDIIEGIKKAIKSDYLKDIKINKKSINIIATMSNGDLRYAYNLLEVAYYSTKDKIVNEDVIKSINNIPSLFIDGSNTSHYDTISAFQKSIRGSDVNASLHYLARLLVMEDLDSIFRRMTVIAYEDIGLANPSIGPKVEAAINACERLGLPEGRIPLGNIIIEMALSPKSNTSHLALDEAINDINKGNIGEIPSHIKTTSNDYKYPFAYKNNYVKQEYLPKKLKGKTYFKPKDNSKSEILYKQIYNKLEQLKKQD